MGKNRSLSKQVDCDKFKVQYKSLHYMNLLNGIQQTDSTALDWLKVLLFGAICKPDTDAPLYQKMIWSCDAAVSLREIFYAPILSKSVKQYFAALDKEFTTPKPTDKQREEYEAWLKHMRQGVQNDIAMEAFRALRENTTLVDHTGMVNGEIIVTTLQEIATATRKMVSGTELVQASGDLIEAFSGVIDGKDISAIGSAIDGFSFIASLPDPEKLAKVIVTGAIFGAIGLVFPIIAVPVVLEIRKESSDEFLLRTREIVTTFVNIQTFLPFVFMNETNFGKIIRHDLDATAKTKLIDMFRTFKRNVKNVNIKFPRTIVIHTHIT